MTGCAGFIGSHLSEELLRQGHHVYGIDDLSTGAVENIKHLTSKKFTFINNSILYVDKPFNDVDWWFHLAARADVVPSIENPNLYHDVNVTGTQRMVELARQSGVKKFVYAASSSCYGDKPPLPTSELCPINPKYPYALTKNLGEQIVMHWDRVYNLPAISLRLFNVYGPRARTSGAYGAVMGTFLSQIAHDAPLTIVGDGEQSRDFVFVNDVVRAFISAAESDKRGVCLNVGSGRPHTINELANLLYRYKDNPGDIEYIPDRPGEPRVTQAHNKAIYDYLGWEARTTFEDGVKFMYSQAEKFKDAPLWDKEKIAKATKTWFEIMR